MADPDGGRLDYSWKQPEIFYKYKRVKLVATAEELAENRHPFLDRRYRED